MRSAEKALRCKILNDEQKDLTPLLDMILEKVPPASTPENLAAPFIAQIFNLAYDNFLGRMGIARIYTGTVKDGQTYLCQTPMMEKPGQARITKLLHFQRNAKRKPC